MRLMALSIFAAVFGFLDFISSISRDPRCGCLANLPFMFTLRESTSMWITYVIGLFDVTLTFLVLYLIWLVCKSTFSRGGVLLGGHLAAALINGILRKLLYFFLVGVAVHLAVMFVLQGCPWICSWFG
jgi:hypothetical protein